MKTNNYRDLKKKDFTTEEFEKREAKLKTFKAERKERHKTKNQKIHQWSRDLYMDEEDL
jgi:hypothetical protein